MPPTIYLLSGLVALALPVAALGPRDGGPVLVVGAPGTVLGAEIVARADGALLRGTLVPWIVLARSDATDFPTRLRQAGAWLVLDASALGGCTPSTRAARPGDPT